MPTVTTVTTDDLKEAFEISSQFSTARLEFCLNEAIRDVKRRIGIEAYGEIFLGDTSTVIDSEYLDENATTTDEVELRTGEVRGAILNYAMANVLINANLRVRASGQVIREQDSGSPSLNAASQVTNEYLKPAQVMEWYNILIAKADGWIRPYLIEQEPISPYGIGKLVRA